MLSILTRKWLRNLFFGKPSAPIRRKQSRTRLVLERLEDRVTPSVSLTTSGQAATFSGGSSDNLYLVSNAGALQYSTDGTAFNTTGMTLNADTTINVHIGGTLHVESLATTAKAAVVIDATNPLGGNRSLDSANVLVTSPVQIEGNISTLGGDLTVYGYKIIEIHPGVVLSTRQTGGGDPLTATSTGDSGKITITTQNPDKFNPFLNIGFNNPQIIVDPGAEILSQADGTFKAGDVTLQASNSNYSLDVLAFPTLSAMVRTANVMFVDGSAGAQTQVKGGAITIEAKSGDLPVSQLIKNKIDADSNGAAWGKGVSDLVNAGIKFGSQAATSQIPGLNKMPLSISVKNAATAVTVGQFAQIDGSGDVTIQAVSTVAASGYATYAVDKDGKLGVAVSFMYGATDAETNVNANALVFSSGGSIQLGSAASSKVDSNASVANIIGSTSPADPNQIQVSLAIAITKQTAHTIVAQGASIVAAQNVDVEANNGPHGGSTKTSASTNAYTDGKAGVTVAVNDSISDIQAVVSGTIIAAGTATGTAKTPSLNINPFTDVDFTNSAIQVPANNFKMFVTGQQLRYDSMDGGPIDGLTSGDNYYVISPARDANNNPLTNEIQLAASLDDARNGIAISFGPYPTLSGTVGGNTVTVPITIVDTTTNTLNFGFNPGFTNGQALVYNPVAGRRIGGLATSGTLTYFAIFDSANPNVLQLSTTANGSAMPLNLDPFFDGIQQNIPVTVNASGQPANSLQFDTATGMVVGDHFVYQGTGITGLTPGATYWAVPTSNPNVIQLAGSLADAQNSTPVVIPLGSASAGVQDGNPLVFDPGLTINPDANTIDLGFNYALVANDLPNGTAIVYRAPLGMTVPGLNDGATYYLIQDSAAPRLLRLTTLNMDPGTGKSYAQEAYDAGLVSYNVTFAALTGSPSANQATAATFGPTWSAAGITNTRAGALPASGSFTVAVDPAASSLDFNYDGGLSNNQPLVYEGPTGANQTITGLTVGTVYYVHIPNPAQPGVIQLTDNAFDPTTNVGNIIPISLTSGTSTTIQFGNLLTSPVTVGQSTLTFGDPSAPPFDPGLQTGDPFFYEGPNATPDNTLGSAPVAGLTPGTIYYAIVDPSAPGTIQLAATLQQAQQGVPLPFGSASGTTTTNIYSASPLAPTDTRPLVVTQFGTVDSTIMSGPAQGFTAPAAGVTIKAALIDKEETKASSGVNKAPQVKALILAGKSPFKDVTSGESNIANTTEAPSSANTVAKDSPSNAVGKDLPGGTGTSPSVAAAGSFAVQYVQDTVQVHVTSTAVIESADNLDVKASLTQKTSLQVKASASKPDNFSGANSKTAALGVAVGLYQPTVKATVDDGAHLDAYGALTVSAQTMYPFQFPLPGSGLPGSNNPLTYIEFVIKDALKGGSLKNFPNGFFNNLGTASVSVPAGAQSPVTLGGNIQVVVYVNDTEATIGNAVINSKVSDNNPLVGNVVFRDSTGGQAVAVTADTQYQNLADAGNFKGLGGTDTAAGQGSGVGASIYVAALDNTTIAEIKSGAQIGIGSAGTLTVTANQKIIAFSLVQAGVEAGDIGFAGTVSWFNLVTVTRAQIDDGVTVSAYDPNGNPMPAGGMSVTALDNMIVIGVTGGAISSQHVGAGFTLAVNNVKRTTLALIGNSTGPATNRGNFNTNFLGVHAASDGIIGSVAYAAATVKPEPPPKSAPPANPSAGSTDSSNPLDGESLPAIPFGDASAGGGSDPLKAPNGYAISGDASANIVQNDTESYINDPGNFIVKGIAPLTIDPGAQPTGTTVIHFLSKHALKTGDAVKFNNLGQSAIGGLQNNATYYAIVLDPYDLELASSFANAVGSIPLTLDASVAVGLQQLQKGQDVLLFAPGNVVNTLLTFASPHALVTGQPVEYTTTGNAIGGLNNKTTYYVIVVSPTQIELADTYANALSGTALNLTLAQGSGTQQLTPVGVAIAAAEQTIVVSIAGAYAKSALAPTGGASNLGVAGSLSTDDLIATTKAYISAATITTTQLDVTADHAGYIGSLTAGAAGASGEQGTAVAGSVSVDLVLPDTEAFISGNANITLTGDSNVTATDRSEIWSIAGSGALGGKGGYGVAIAINLIGFSNKTTIVPNQPAQTLAYISGANITISAGTLSVLATNANAAVEPRIVAITGALGTGTETGGNAAAGMISVNIIKDETNAYIVGSSILQPAAGAGPVNLKVQGEDDSWIIAVGGAVGVANQTGVGAGIGYNEIGANTRAYIDSSSVGTLAAPFQGAVTVQAVDHAQITGGTVGLGVSQGMGGIAGAGSASVNKISNIIDAHISGATTASNVQATGDVSVTALDNAYIVSVAGGVAFAKGGSSVGAAVSYNLIQNTITGYINNATVHSTTGGMTVSANSSATLIAIALGAGGGQNFTLGGSITVNSIASTEDAHISGGSHVATDAATGNINVSAGESATMYVIAGGLAYSSGASAVGAAIAYNFVGGGFDPANPNIIDNKPTATDSITAYVDNSTVTAGGTLTVAASFGPPSTSNKITSVAIPGQAGAAPLVTVPLPTLDMSYSQFVSVTVGGAGGDTFTLGGAVNLNFIHNTIDSHVSGSAIVQGQAISVTAQNNATITSVAGGLGLGFAGSGVGLSFTSNDMASSVKAYIDHATAAATTFDVHVNANDASTIFNVTFGGGGGDNVGAGAGISLNWLRNDVEAYINDGSAVTARNNVFVTAADQPNIGSDAVGGGGGTIGAGIAISYNYIGGDPGNPSRDISSNYKATGTSTTVTINNGDTVQLKNSFAGKGQLGTVYQYIGTSGQTIDLSTQDYTNSALWQADNPPSTAVARVLASIDAASVVATTGDVNVQASSAPSITNITLAGGGGSSVGGGGSVSVNFMGNLVDAHITNATGANPLVSSPNAVAANRNVNVQSSITPTMFIIAGAAGGGSSAGAGVAVATNDLQNNVQARVETSTVTATTGNVLIDSEVTPPNASALLPSTYTANATSHSVTVMPGQTVTIQAGFTGQGVVGGRYQYIGNANRMTDLSTEDFTNTTNWKKTESPADFTVGAPPQPATFTAVTTGQTVNLEAGFTGQGNIGSKYQYIGGQAPATYFSGDGPQTVGTGQTVDVRSNHTGGGLVSHRYQYIGTNPKTTNLGTENFGDTTIWQDLGPARSATESIDLSHEDFTNTANWKLIGSTSTADAQIWAFCAAGAGGGDGALAGSVSVNWARNKVDAHISSSSAVDANQGTVTVSAADNATIKSLAGAVSGAGDGAIGAAVALNYIGGNPDNSSDRTNNVLQAYIDNSTVNGSSVVVTATSNAAINTLSFAGSAAGTFAGAGSFALNWVRKTVEAEVSGGSRVTSTGNISILAADSSGIRSLAAQATGAGTAAAGAAVAYNEIDNTIKGHVDGSTVTVTTGSSGNIGINATSSSSIETIAAGLSVSGEVSLAGSAAANLVGNDVEAYITGSTVSTAQNLAILANVADLVHAYVGTLSGSGAVGAGASVIVNQLNNTTRAYITGNSIIVAPGTGAGIAVPKWATSADGTSSATDIAAGTSSTQTINGLAVIANSTEDIEDIAVTAGLGGDAGVAANVTVNLLGDTTEAYISGSKVNSATATGQSVIIRAHQQTHFISGGGSLGIGLSLAGVGASVDTNILNNTTRAYIADDNAPTNVNPVFAGAGVEVSAVEREKGLSASVGAGIGLFAGVAGAASVIKTTSLTEAYVRKATITATGDIVVDADSGVDAHFGVGAAAGGGVGAGASVAVGLFQGTTQGYAVGATLNATNDVKVEADSAEYLARIVATGSVGVGAVAGSVSVMELSSKTYAYIGAYVDPNTQSVTGPTVTAGRDVSVLANDTTSINQEDPALVGTIAAGGSGFGASVDVITVQNDVSAYISGSGTTVSAARNVNVKGNANRSIKSTVIAFAGGAGYGISGAVSVISVGSGLDSDSVSQSNQANPALSNASNISQQGIMGIDTSRSTGQDVKNAGTANTVSISIAANANTQQGTTAFIGAGATVTAGGGDMVVDAEETETLHIGCGAVAIGGIAGVGGSVAIANIASAVKAWIEKKTQISATGNVTIQARYMGNVDNNAIGGSAGLVGLGAQYAVTNDTSSELAYIQGAPTAADGAQITNAAALNVTASATRADTVDAEGASGGALAAGAAIGKVSAGGTTQASLGTYTQVGQTGNSVGSVTVSATATDTASSKVLGVAAGIGAGTFNDSEAQVNPTVQAYVDAASMVTTTNAIQVLASETPTSSALCTGVAVGAVGLGASVANATSAAKVDAYVGANDTTSSVSLSGGSLTVSAQQLPASVSSTKSGLPTAYAMAIAGGGGTLLGANATSATAAASGEVKAYTGNSVQLPNGDVTIMANNQTVQQAAATGVAIGFIGIGADLANASSGVSTSANLGTNATTSSGRSGAITVLAKGTDNNSASSTAGSGGVYAGNASSAMTTDNSTSQAGIGSGGKLTAGVVTVSATNTSNYAPTASSLNASAVGASGAAAANTDATSATVNVGDNVAITATGLVMVAAQNKFQDTMNGPSVSAGAGGLANGSAASSQSALNGTSVVTLGNLDNIQSGTDPNTNPGGIVVLASSTLQSSDDVTLTAGGALAGAGVMSSLKGNLNNSVAIGSNSQFTSKGNIGAGTYTTVNAQTKAEVTTYGIATVGSASATTNLATIQSVTLGANTTVTADGNVNLNAGNDPTGQFNTVLNGGSEAQGYVRGLIAIPVASATTNLISNATLTIAAGDQISSGQNVNIGAFPGKPTPTAVGTGHGFEVGFIPVMGGTSSPTGTSSSSVTQNGTITAGIYHELNITIPNDSSAGAFSSTINVNPDGAPTASFTRSFDPSFSPVSYINLNFPTTAMSLLPDVSSTPVGAMTLGPLYAAGGNVTVNADTIQGTGTITANGMPIITVTNNSPDYLILGAITIPLTPAGQVVFTGAAGQATAQQAGITVNQTGGSGAPSITINEAFTGPVGTSTSNSGPALFLMGTIQNQAGAVSITNAFGDLGQAGSISAQSMTITVPNGTLVVGNPNADYQAGGDPSAQWGHSTSMIWPGGNPYKTVNVSATTAITYVANAMFNSNGQYTSNYDLTRRLIGRSGDPADGSANQSFVYLGNDVPETGTGVGSESANAALSPIQTGTPTDSAYNMLQSTGGKDDGWFPMIPVQPVTTNVYSYPGDVVAGSLSSMITARKVLILAHNLDVNGPITAGSPTSYSVSLPASLTQAPSFNVSGGALWQDKYNYDHGYVASPIFDVPTLKFNGLAAPIDVTYNAATNHLTVQNVSASAVGASVTLYGNIISTNPLGHIHVNGGFGQVNVDNQTGLSLEVQNVYTGSNSAATAGVSQVDITDNNLLGNNHTLYVFQPGQGISVYNGPAGSTLQSGGLTLSNTLSGQQSTTFNPAANLRWGWTETASLSRQVDQNGLPITGGNWAFNLPTPRSNDPWQYAGGQAFLASSALPVFQETITARQHVIFTPINYHNKNFGFAPQSPVQHESDGREIDPWAYNYVDAATLTLTSSVKADNPINIDFSGVASGSVSINSNAPVLLTGNITNPTGTTTISAVGDITEAPTKSIQTQDLTLTATNGIGSPEQPLAASLAGVLNAQASSAGVFLALSSGALIGQVSAGGGLTGYGDVVIQATNDLSPQTVPLGANVNVTGNNITLNSTGGGVGTTAPLVISANPGLFADGSPDGGVVNVSAQGSINLTESNGNLRVGNIASTNGDVSLNAPTGSILAVNQDFTVQALDVTQTQSVSTDLHLTDPTFAQTAVTSFQSLVVSDYQQYWELLMQGSVTNGTYTLSPSATSLYSAQTAAALNLADPTLNITNPTPAQVQTYASNQYQLLVAFFNNNLAANYSTTVDFQAFNPQFQYTATAAQVTALTKNELWTQNELKYAVNASSLSSSAGASSGNATPAIAGRTVTLNAQNDLGSLAPPIEILQSDLDSGNLTAVQSAALALATTPGDVMLEGTDSQGNTVMFQFLHQPAGVTYKGIQVSVPTPLLVSVTGALNTTVGGVAFLQSTKQDLPIGQVQAGGTVRLNAPNNVVSTQTGSTNVTTQGDVRVYAGGGNLGLASGQSPLTVQAGGLLTGTLNLIANNNINLDSNGSFNVQLNGLAAHQAYDQLETTGPDRMVALNNTVLNVALGSFQPVNGDAFAIIHNDDPSSTISGTFKGLPEGASFTLASGPTCTITYRGGANQNDVVLTMSNAATLQSIAVAPASSATPTILSGGTQQFTATGTYSDGSTRDLTAQVTWSVVPSNVATISLMGLATGAFANLAVIAAKLGPVEGDSSLVVTNLAPAATNMPSVTNDFAQNGTAFARDVQPGSSIPALNDGNYGPASTWLSNAVSSFAGISFGTTMTTVCGVACSSDNTGTNQNHALGTYTLQYTTVDNPDQNTPDSAWTTIGSQTYTSTTFDPWLQHVYAFNPVQVTGIRLQTQSASASDLIGIDELSLYAQSPVFAASNGSVYVLGTSGHDNIHVTASRDASGAVIPNSVTVLFNKTGTWGPYPTNGKPVTVFGQGGHDTITVDPAFTGPIRINSGDQGTPANNPISIATSNSPAPSTQAQATSMLLRDFGAFPRALQANNFGLAFQELSLFYYLELLQFESFFGIKDSNLLQQVNNRAQALAPSLGGNLIIS